MSPAIRHIGNFRAICNKSLYANLRTDLDAARYKRLGVRERLLNELPYRICARCIRVVAAVESGRMPWERLNGGFKR